MWSLHSLLRDPAVSRTLRRLFLGAVALTAVALLGGAAFLGWRIHDWTAEAPKTAVAVTINRPVNVVQEHQADAGTMPNVLGLPEQTARQVFADAALDPSRIATTPQPYAGESGIVISQDPAAGTPPGQGKLYLTVSAPAKMPRLVGAVLDDARTPLAQLGATVLIKSRYKPNAAENSVLATEPTAGQPLTDRATLVIAEPPSSVFLNQLRAIDSDCSTETLNVAGTQRQDALVCQPNEGSPAAMDYVLNRHVASLAVAVGLGDRGANDAPVTFRVFVDGKRAFAETLRFGQAHAIRIPVVGALRIHLEADVPKQGPSGEAPQAVFAGARFLGGRTAIDNLVAESSS